MRITLVNQYYVPDVAPTARYLADLARGLAARGHEVRVVCSRRAYAGGRHRIARERRDGVLVYRLHATGFGRSTHAGRVLDYASFYVALAVHLCAARPRPDLILCLTTPPLVGFLGRMAAAVRRCAHAHWIMDVYPDAMVAGGMLRAGSTAGRLLSCLSRVSLRKSALTLTVGPDMAARLAAGVGGDAGARVEWVPLWALTCFDTATPETCRGLRAKRGWPPGTTIFLYSGNMGLGHRVDEFLQAALRCAGPESGAQPAFRLAFAGDGRRRHVVQRFVHDHPDAPVDLLRYAPVDELAAHLRSADVLLLSLDPDWCGCLLPSKIQTAFASGRPVLFLGSPDSTPARWIVESGAGWTVAPGDTDGLCRAMLEGCSPGERERRAARAVDFAKKHFDAETNAATICDLIERRMPNPERRSGNAVP